MIQIKPRTRQPISNTDNTPTRKSAFRKIVPHNSKHWNNFKVKKVKINGLPMKWSSIRFGQSFHQLSVKDCLLLLFLIAAPAVDRANPTQIIDTICSSKVLPPTTKPSSIQSQISSRRNHELAWSWFLWTSNSQQWTIAERGFNGRTSHASLWNNCWRDQFRKWQNRECENQPQRIILISPRDWFRPWRSQRIKHDAYWCIQRQPRSDWLIRSPRGAVSPKHPRGLQERMVEAAPLRIRFRPDTAILAGWLQAPLR